MYVISTLTAATTYAYGHKDFPDGVTIQGGANVADPRTIVTPKGGVVTKVSDAQISALQDDPTFKLHRDNGFIEVTKSRPEPEAAASDMQSRDASAPFTPEDAIAEGAKPLGTSEEAAAPAEAPRNPRRA